MRRLFVDGVEVELIEMIGEILVVQEINSKIIYNIQHYDIDSLDNADLDDKMDTNVISLTGWEQWKKRKEVKKLRNLKRNLRRCM